MNGRHNRNKFGNIPTEGLVAPPDQAIPTLDDALQRYLAMNCVTHGVVPLGRVLRDRTAYYHLYERCDGNHPKADVGKQLEFMHAVSGLPKSWCAYWIYMDWLKVIAGKASDSEVERLVYEGYEIALSITEGEGDGFAG